LIVCYIKNMGPFLGTFDRTCHLDSKRVGGLWVEPSIEI
jgi:hypothetical protein